jgi:cell division protein FtsQ
MRDLKSPKPVKVKENRRKRNKEPRDWGKLFHRTLRLSVFLGSLTLILCGGILAVRLVRASGFFRVETIRVLGQQRVPKKEILALSDIRPGMSIFSVDLERVGRKIEDDPWIATARVERAFPREVTIRVTERIPKAIINLDYLYYVDRSGKIFKLLERGDSLDFPVITGIDRQSLLHDPAGERRLLDEAIGLIDDIGKRTPFGLKDVAEVHVDQTGEITLYSAQGAVPIRMGWGNFSEKLARLERIYPQLGPRLSALKYIDLNVMDRIIVKVDSGFTHGRG